MTSAWEISHTKIAYRPSYQILKPSAVFRKTARHRESTHARMGEGIRCRADVAGAATTPASGAVDDDEVNAVGAMRAQHQRLFDIGGTRGPGNEIGRARELTALAAHEGEAILMTGDDT